MANDTKNEAQFADIDALFAADLDDIADLPAFEVPPEGTYIGTVSCDLKEINKKSAVEAEFTVTETSELEDDSVTPCAQGTKFSVAFILGSNIAEGKLKQFLAPFAAHFGTTKVGELVRDRVKDVTIAFTLKHRTNKKGDDPDRIYPDVRNVTVV
jgi:hypothetical protein